MSLALKYLELKVLFRISRLFVVISEHPQSYKSVSVQQIQGAWSKPSIWKQMGRYWAEGTVGVSLQGGCAAQANLSETTSRPVSRASINKRILKSVCTKQFSKSKHFLFKIP